MHWLKLPFIILGTLVTVGVAGTSATIGDEIVTGSTCTQVSPSYSIGNCRTSVAGIPLSWVHEANDNIVTTVIGSIITIRWGHAAPLSRRGRFVVWIRSRKQTESK